MKILLRSLTIYARGVNSKSKRYNCSMSSEAGLSSRESKNSNFFIILRCTAAVCKKSQNNIVLLDPQWNWP